jgi:hypothetical protein
MDDLINELAVQAGAELYGPARSTNIIVNDQDADALMRKFARLIAAECAELCADIDGGENMFSRAIRERFGVE